MKYFICVNFEFCFYQQQLTTVINEMLCLWYEMNACVFVCTLVRAWKTAQQSACILAVEWFIGRLASLRIAHFAHMHALHQIDYIAIYAIIRVERAWARASAFDGLVNYSGQLNGTASSLLRVWYGVVFDMNFREITPRPIRGCFLLPTESRIFHYSKHSSLASLSFCLTPTLDKHRPAT